MNIYAGNYVMLKPVDEVKSLYKKWKTIFTSKNALGKVEVFVDTGDRYFSHVMLNAMDACDVYRVAWSDDNRVCVFIGKDAYAFDKKCIKDIYRLVKIS